MYFVHPQIEISLKNFKKIFLSFFKKEDFEKLKEFFPNKEIVFTDMGRTALRLILKELNLEKKEILMPAFICDVFLPILKEYDLKPIFVDVEKETFNLSLKKIKEKLTPETKAILLCHTFGLPLNVKEIKKEIRKDILIIEDCAHAFLARTENGLCGNFGDVAFFSLYKQFPMARGGIALLPQVKTPFLKTKFSPRDLISFLNHFSFFAFLFKSFGKKIAPSFQRKEKRKEIALLNQFSLKIFFSFLDNFEKRIERRKEIAFKLKKRLEKFDFQFQETKDNIFTFFSFLVPPKIKRDDFVKFLWKKRIFATRIWKDPIVSNPLCQKNYSILPEEFPNTLDISKRIVNLPLQDFYKEKDLKKIISAIENYFQRN